MATVREHLRTHHLKGHEFHKSLAEHHRAVAGHHRSLSKAHEDEEIGKLHKHIAKDHESMAQLCEGHANHCEEMAKLLEALTPATKAADDQIMPTRVSGIAPERPGFRMVPRTGQPEILDPGAAVDPLFQHLVKIDEGLD